MRKLELRACLYLAGTRVVTRILIRPRAVFLLSGFLCDKTVRQADFRQPARHTVIYEGVMFT